MIRRRLLGIAAIAIVGTAYYLVAGQLELARISMPLPSTSQASLPVPFDQAALLADLGTLAAPAFEGRKTGSAGGAKARGFLLQRYAAIGLAPFGASYVQPFSFVHTSIKGLVTPGKPYKTPYQGANVIGFIPGTHNAQRYIVISAHYDHLGMRDGRLYPGADDNASGVAALLATAAWFKAHPPRNTVVFAAFDGEELGLRGAHAFLQALPFPKAQLALNLNFDMVSRNDKNRIFVAGSRYTPALVPLVAQAARRSTVGVLLGHDRPPLLAGEVEDWTDASDHGPFHDAGIPFLYFGVEDHDDYHSPRDTFDHIMPGFFVNVTALLIDVAATLDQQF